MDEKKRKVEWWLILVGVAESIVLLSLCFSQGVWGDEMFTFQTVDQNFRDMTLFTARDVHPPLYYYIVKLAITVFGRNILVVKFVTAFASIGMIIFGITKVWNNWGTKTALLFLLSVICMPQMLRYSVQLRMYSWAMFFVLLTLLEFYDIVREQDCVRTWIVMILGGLAAAYTHYYALIAVGVIYSILFVHLVRNGRKKQIKKLLVVLLVSVIGYLPWLVSFVRQISMVKEDYWIEPITMHGILQMLLFAFLPREEILGGLLILVYAVAGVLFIRSPHKQQKIQDIYGVITYLGVLLVGVILSVVIRPIFVSRYLMPVMPALYLGFSILMKESKKYIYVVGVVVLLVAGMISYAEVYAEEYPKGMKETQIYLEESISDGDVILSDFGEAVVALDYYYPRYLVYFYSEIETVVKEHPDKRIWLFALQEETVDELEAQGYQIDMCYENGRLDSMIFTLYRISEEE